MRDAKILQTQTKGAHVMFYLTLGIMILIGLLACWCVVNTEVSDHDEQ
jgi:cytochrome b561